MIRGIPTEQIRVAENAPAVSERVGSKIIEEINRLDAGNENEQRAGDCQRLEQNLFHELIFQFSANRGGLLIERPARRKKEGGDFDFAFQISDFKSLIPNSRSRISNLRFEISDSRFLI